MRSSKALWAACAIAAAICAGDSAARADSTPAPYSHLPTPGDVVHLDGSLGGATTAWAYADQFWLEEYLKVTIDAAASNEQYSAATEALDRISSHVTPVPNGVKAYVETLQPFSYKGRLDVEVRVSVQEGPLKGRELWTTCAELVDPAGHRYLRM